LLSIKLSIKIIKYSCIWLAYVMVWLVDHNDYQIDATEWGDIFEKIILALILERDFYLTRFIIKHTKNIDIHGRDNLIFRYSCGGPLDICQLLVQNYDLVSAYEAGFIVSCQQNNIPVATYL